MCCQKRWVKTWLRIYEESGKNSSSERSWMRISCVWINYSLALSSIPWPSLSWAGGRGSYRSHTSHQLATSSHRCVVHCSVVQCGILWQRTIWRGDTQCVVSTQRGVAQCGVAHGARKSQLTSSAPHGSVTVRVKKGRQQWRMLEWGRGERRSVGEWDSGHFWRPDITLSAGLRPWVVATRQPI